MDSQQTAVTGYNSPVPISNDQNMPGKIDANGLGGAQLELSRSDSLSLANPNAPAETIPAAPRTPFEIALASAQKEKYNQDAWRSLIKLAEDSADLAQIKAAYEALLEVHPNSVCQPVPTTA